MNGLGEILLGIFCGSVSICAVYMIGKKCKFHLSGKSSNQEIGLSLDTVAAISKNFQPVNQGLPIDTVIEALQECQVSLDFHLSMQDCGTGRTVD